MLSAVGRLIESGNQLKVVLTSPTRGRESAADLDPAEYVFKWSGNTAAPLTARQRWERIWKRILAPYLLPSPAHPGPSG